MLFSCMRPTRRNTKSACVPKSYIDVQQSGTRIFGGGGHVRAAGCTMQGSMHDVVNNLTSTDCKSRCRRKYSDTTEEHCLTEF